MNDDIKNLDVLADQIYQEGIEKVNREGEDLLAEARREAEAIKEKAQEEADKTVRDAENKASQLRSSTETELQAKTKQILSELKDKIEHQILHDVLEDPTEKSFQDEDFIKNLILQATSRWVQSDELDLILPDDLMEQVGSFIKEKLSEKLPGLTIKANAKMKSGFVIKRIDEGYLISFTDEDFREYLRPYFSTHIRKMMDL